MNWKSMNLHDCNYILLLIKLPSPSFFGLNPVQLHSQIIENSPKAKSKLIETLNLDCPYMANITCESHDIAIMMSSYTPADTDSVLAGGIFFIFFDFGP